MTYNLAFPGTATKFLLRAYYVAVVLLLAGCGSLNALSYLDITCESQPAFEGAANLSLFLNVQRQDPSRPNLNLKISSIELLVDDSWVPVSSELLEINSLEAIPVQRFLGRQWLQGQYCRGVRVKVAGAAMSSRSDGIRALTVINPEAVIMLQDPIELETGSRKVLLLDWDPEKSVSEAGFEGMSLQAFQGVERITANLVYVVCPEIDTIYVVRIDKRQVVDAFSVTGNPAYLTVDPGNKKIHVLSSSLNKITSYDISRLLSGIDIQIPLAVSPIFMVVNNRSQSAYVLDAQGVLTSIDLVSGNMLSRNRVGNKPNYLYYIPKVEKLAVSSTIDHTVYLVNPVTLAVEDSIALASAPLGLVNWGNYLYIAEGSANTVSVYDLSTRKMLEGIKVGFEPSRFVTDASSVYLTNFLAGTISVIQGGQLSVSKEVAVGKLPREMGLAEKQRLLFVGTGDCDGSLAVVDTTGNAVIARIELGAKPMGIVVVE